LKKLPSFICIGDQLGQSFIGIESDQLDPSFIGIEGDQLGPSFIGIDINY
jgi:hypothetical protein